MSRNAVTITLHKNKALYYRNRIESVKDKPKQVLKTVNQILNRNQQESITNNIKSYNGQISNLFEISECLNNYFADIGSKIAETVQLEMVNVNSMITL